MIDNGYNECVEFDECADCMIHYSDDKPEVVVVKNATSQNRFKSWALWLSVAGAISVIFTAFNLWDKIGITSDTFQDIVTSIGAVLIAGGIVNNPTRKDGW